MWHCLGVLDGGTVGGLVTVEDADGHAVVAVTPAGCFRSADGRSWSPVSTEAGPALADAVAASRTFAQDGTLVVGGRTGVWRSSDGGRSWRQALTGEVLSVALSPSFEADGILFAGTAQDGVLQSETGGLTWSGANSGLLDLSVLTVAFSPRFADDKTAFAGTASGLYRSRNGGKSWREVRLDVDQPAVQVLAVSPRYAADRLVFAGTEAHGLLRSDDGGARFVEVPEFAEQGISALTVSPDGRTIVVASGDEVSRSTDAGHTWEPLPDAPGLVLGLALLPTADDGSVLVAGLHRLGVARLDGDDWSVANDGLRASLLTGLVPSPGFADDQTLFGISIDEGLLASRDAGVTWTRRWPEDAEPAITALVASGSVLLASAGDRLMRSVDGGDSWETLPPDSAPPFRLVVPLPAGGPGIGLVGAGDATLDGRHVVAVGLSEDGGTRWQPGGALAAAEAGWSLEVGALAASPGYWQDRTLFARGVETRADGRTITRLWRSTDGGRSWSVWFEEVGPVDPQLSATLLVPPAYRRDGTVVMAIGDRVLTPVAGAWERQGGQRRPVWQAADLGRAVASVTVLTAPPADAARAADQRTVYAGTNAGPYVSRDGGRTFRPWLEGYDGGGVVAVAVSPSFASDRTVFAVSVGGAIWRAEDR